MKVDPKTLSTLSPADLRAMVRQAREAAAAERTTAARRERVSLPAESLAMLDTVGWAAPFANEAHVWDPKGAASERNCAMLPFYEIVGASLTVGPVRIEDAAMVLLSCYDEGEEVKRRAIGSLMQTLANRLQRSIKQDGAIFTLSGVTGA